jgi:hypothetical protein
MRTKFTDGEFDVLVKLHRNKRLTLKDHFTLAKMYQDHGVSSIVMAMRNLSGALPHINKRLAEKNRTR